MSANNAYINIVFHQLLLLLLIDFGSLYQIPKLQFEAFSPRGFRVSIPDEDGLKYFAFHGSINNHLNELEPGELIKEVGSATNGRWVYDAPDVVLHIGDSIGYWVFVQYQMYGYRKDNQTWEVDVLKKRTGGANDVVAAECPKSQTIISGKQACAGELIFEDNFNRLQYNKWTPQKYYPYHSPNYEFNYYLPECVSVQNSKLIITPQVTNNENDIRGTLDLRDGCTSTRRTDECLYEQFGSNYLPPVKSGEVQSQFTFKYGRIEFDAKLPCGDWIYPEISLLPSQDINRNRSTIVLAYSRGNEVLKPKESNGDDIGGTLLFSGFSSEQREPMRSLHLASTRVTNPICKTNHKFKVVWDKDKIYSYLDNFNKPFGEITMRQNMNFVDSEYLIRLGVSIGGQTNFPDNYETQNGVTKPWRNFDQRSLGNFFKHRNQWLSTWGSDVALEIDNFKVYAL